MASEQQARRPRGRPSGTDAGVLKDRILDAAAEEFAQAGYTGARIERIAEAAGCNRSLVYFYFEGKAELFEAVLDATAEHRAGQMAGQPRSLAEGLVYWFGRNFAEPRRIRLIMQEALAPPLSTRPPRHRQAYLEQQLGVVKAFQAAGLLRSDMGPRHLLTMFLALTSFPACFPKVAAAALDAPEDQALVAEWSSCLRNVAAILSPEAAGTTG